MLMKRPMSFIIVLLFVSALASCGMPAAVPPAATLPQATATRQQAAATVAQVAQETAAAEATQEPVPFPLSEPGPYYTGKRTYTFEDTGRDGREIGVTVFYPAVLPEGSKGDKLQAGADRDPDLSGAPYRLILTGPDTGDRLFKAHLASHGFVMAIVRFREYYDEWDLGVVDHPRDILFALDQIASQPLEGLEGVIDSDHAGVAGYSWEGFYTFTLSGVRIAPEHYFAFCEQDPAMVPEMSAWYFGYVCNLAKKWDEFAAYVGDEITASEDGLWQPITDDRIRAVMPMAEYGTWLYDERGLATADRPMFIIAPTEDEYTPYQIETAYVFEHVGSPERFLVSFVGRGHMMVIELEQMKRINHFATAFFGTYLQNKPEYHDYFSEDFVSQFDDLTWGVYTGE
jgi:predicted dienelactone hydrolase